MTTYTKAFFGQAGNPHFDLEVAIDAYEWVMAHPEEAPFVVSKMLFDNTSTLMEYYSPQIEEVCKGYVSKRIDDATRGLSRSVSKSAVDSLGVVAQVSKAFGRDPRNRDQQGQFSTFEERQIKAAKEFNDRPRYGGGSNPIPAGSQKVALDALAAMTDSPGFAEYVMRTGREAEAMTNNFENKWGRNVKNDQGVNDQTWRRLSASSKLAYDMGGKYLPEQAQFALKVGEWAGNYAPQAERVIGPTARRSAYRYRGVEKKPDPVFQRDIDTLRLSSKSGKDAHEALIFGSPSEHARGRDASGGLFEDRSESRTITRMKELLPDASLYELNRKSGTIPPSQGIIIDRSGKVVTEAVGYGEDWYLPFNLKNLSRLKGGEYIRTRSYGGLTTEDIYVGLVSGARAVTVVSHSGTYTMEFDDDFRGARRYNDKAGRMHARYAQLLDAVKSGDVQMSDISPSRLSELRTKAAMLTGMEPDDDAVEGTDEFKKLRLRERRDPELSQVDKDAAAIDGINQFLIDNPKFRNFNQFSDQTGITDPLQAAETLGAQHEVTRAVKAAEQINADNLNPLKLNGRGYGKAMKALQQQFPYYIARAEYIAPGGGAQDMGYVKPKFIRPEGAMSGYYDKSIEGTTKLSADRTNYQNFSVIGKPGDDKYKNFFAEKKEEKAAEEKADATTPAAGEAKAKPKDPDAADYAKYQKAAAAVDLIKEIRAVGVLGVAAGDSAGLPVSDKDKAVLGIVFLDPIEDIEDKVMRDPAYATRMAQQLKQVKDLGIVDVNPTLWRDWSSNGATKVIPYPDSNFRALRGIGTDTFDIPAVKAGQAPERYDAIIGDLLRNPDLKILGATNEDPNFMSPERTYDEVLPVIKEQAKKLIDIDAEFQAYALNERVSTPPGWSKEKVKSMTRQLVTLSQAYQQRDLARKEVAPVAPKVEEEAPKAEAPDQGAVIDYQEKLLAAAAPHQGKIHALIGMDGVANEVDKLVAQAVISKAREKAGLKVESRPMHLIFTGAPGTGKTTVAEILAPLYHDLGLLEKPTVKTLTKSEIQGPFNNQVEEHTRKVMNENKGGVIIIDEAYSLASDAEGRKAITEMVPMLSNELKDTVVILAGYPDEMRDFLAVNQGLDRRFPKTIKFRNYSAPEMRKIADKMLADREYTATKPSTIAAIEDAVGQLALRPNNGNAGGVSNFINHARDAQEVRLMKVKNPSKQQLAELTAADIKYAMMAMDLTPTPVKRAPRKKAA